VSELVMPRLSDTMEEGTVLRWLKQDGEHVRRGEELVEIETDKATMIYESDRDGVLQTVAREGDTLAVGELIAQIGGTDGNGAAAAQPVLAGEPQRRTPNAPPSPASPTQPLSTSPMSPAPTTPRGGDRVKASPLARRIASESGVDLQTLIGSGPGGRIVKADVQAATTEPAPAEAPAPPQPPSTPPVKDVAGAKGETTTVEEVASAKGETTTWELSRLQRTIARRMAESKATIPDFTLQADVDMERCVALRAELKRLGQATAPTYNDMVVKACALALREHPRANGSYRDGRFELHSRVNVGVAVAVDSDDPLKSALVVPTVLDADVKSLGEIARETRALAERVRDATITPPELSGGTFTVSNLGMYGIKSFTAIINPPQAAILAVGSVAPRAVVDDANGLVARQEMTVTLACDHRILYGADAALFLARVRELLEEPAALTL
jgi:pyruvate dehydrogenase E2 component (dihydrolipoamide acetyltransferase)